MQKPDKFPKHWEEQLETELRSRKYSSHTIDSYIYYNRLLCNTIQKTPEEIQADDVTLFLAKVEKQREYSSSSLNLAISAIKFFYKNMLRKDFLIKKIRPKQDRRLPMVLDKD